MERGRIDLCQDEIPTKWYNLQADMPVPLPPYLEVETGKEVRKLPETFSRTACQLEFAEERWIEIPRDVLIAYIHCGRPTPLIRAHRLEKFLNTSARIYYKCEDLPPAGTFKTNTAIPQAYWAMKEGYNRTIFTGSVRTRTKFAHVFSAKLFNLIPTVFMARADCQRNLGQVFMLKNMFEADLVESPSTRTELGRKLLRENPNHPGSRESAQSEVEEEAKNNKDGVTVISSFLNHVLMTQTIIGLETKRQLESIDEDPDVLVGSVGGGSHFFGFIAPFLSKSLRKGMSNMKLLAVESETSCKLTGGAYDYARLSEPGMSSLLVKTYRLIWKTSPAPISGLGIQTQTTAPLLSMLRHLGFIQTRVYLKNEKDIVHAARIFLQTEGRLLAPESAYAIRATIDEALKAKRAQKKMVIVASVSGTAFLDFGEKTGYSNLT
jgi:tryptophan synthase beta chain